MKKVILISIIIVMILPGAAGCRPALGVQNDGGLHILAVETFLGDIAQNVAGERTRVDTLIPAGLDPHAFEPTPQDAARIQDASVLIINGAGLEAWLGKLMINTGKDQLVISASEGLAPRAPAGSETAATANSVHEEGDPHFWLNPLNVIRYVENIRDGLIQADPDGKEIYNRNADAYIARLKDLDIEIRAQVEQIPTDRRLLVTNHESFGYFADRYGFTVIGTILPGASSSASPSAMQMVDLIEKIRSSGAPAVFLETGSSPMLAEQIGQETGIRVISNLYTHSLTAKGGEAPTYIDLMKHNTEVICAALK